MNRWALNRWARRGLTAAVLLALAVRPAPARAEWIEASSDHFVIYAEASDAGLTRLAERLERFHAALEYAVARPMGGSPSNRLTVYAVSDLREVRALAGGGDRTLGALYIPRAGASMAIVPRPGGKFDGAAIDLPMVMLLHEYAHHFLASAGAPPMPRWLSEGAAEFFASASFDADGGIALGRPARHRARELSRLRGLRLADLFDAAPQVPPHAIGAGAFYGRSWLLYHYLTFDEARGGQLRAYSAALMAGRGPRAAAVAAFGDLAALERDLERYRRQPEMRFHQVPPQAVGPIRLRRLSVGEAAMMPVRIRVHRGVSAWRAGELLAEARAIAARFPRDAAVLATLAEAAHDAGYDGEAIAAADAAIAADPAQPNAYRQKALALFRMAGAAAESLPRR